MTPNFAPGEVPGNAFNCLNKFIHLATNWGRHLPQVNLELGFSINQ